MKMQKLLMKMKWRPVLLVSLCLLLLGVAEAQNRKITGTIRGVDGKPVEDASVVVRGTTRGTSSAADGSFSIDARTGDVLVVTSVGFLLKESTVGSGSTVDFSLTASTQTMDEVVVIGYGQMKKTDVSSSQVSVSAQELQRTVNPTFDQALQGRAANVYVSSQSGQPGAAPSVVIRGVSSLTGSTQPLYVIDGVQIKPSNPSDDPNAHPTGFTNILSGLNPDDIESINVLQGPSATAIYGTSGANGVILVTTKRGKSGESKISANTLWTMQDLPEKISVMDLQQYAAYRNEIARAGGTATEPAFNDPEALGKGTDWQGELFRRTVLQKHGLSLSGGSASTTFFLSGEYFNQDGVAPGSGFQRASVRVNLDNQTRKWLKIGTNLAFNRTQEKVNTTNAGIITLALRQNPSVPVTNPDGSWGGPNTTQFAFSNPVALANINNDYNKAIGMLGGAYATINFGKGFSLHNEVNTSLQYYNNYQFHPGYQFNGFVVPSTSASSTRAANNNYWWGLNSRLHYDKKFNKHGIAAMVAHEAQSFGSEGLSGYRQNFVTYNIQELSGGVQTTSLANSTKSDGARESYFGRLNYVYDEKYIIQGSFRRDGSSAFGSNKRWANFPAVSAAWRISQEDFMRDITSVNDLKLRLEYGSTGNSSGGGVYAQLQAVPTAWGTGFLPQNFANPDLQWEITKTSNIGFDLHMFNNRLEVIGDAYIKKIDRLLTTNPFAFYNGGDIAYSPGYISWPTTNVGKMENRGFGLTVNTVNISNKEFSWKTGFNISRDRSKITQLLTAIKPSYDNGVAQFLSQEGGAPSLFTGYIAEGIFQNYDEIKNHARQTPGGLISPGQGTWIGDIKFRDISGPEGKPDGVIDQFDRTVLGNPWPKFSFGFNNYFTFKNFDLNIFIIGTIGNDVVNYERFRNEQPLGTGTFSNYYSSVSNFARPTSYNINDSLTTTLINPGNSISRIAPGDPNGNARLSQWYVEDGSYIRLKNIALGYTLPGSLTKRFGVQRLRVSVNAQNLITITDYSGYDPEIGMVQYGGTLISGVDSGRYPNVRMYSAQVVIDF
ncbi:MAG: TonB-dependent receptor [Chitinophagaceae bacterium]|nr:MAG: TonB-dependent receptor [Chitinophagaceae bacterium]